VDDHGKNIDHVTMLSLWAGTLPEDTRQGLEKIEVPISITQIGVGVWDIG
jgi:hypothetical protein